MKRIILTLLAMLLTFSLISCDNLEKPIDKKKVYVSGDFEIATHGNDATIVKYIGQDKVVEIPENIDRYKITAIDHGAFFGCYNLTKLIIPSSVTTVGDYAFSICENLTEIIIPDSVTTIGDYAFYYCKSLAEINIPSSVTAIGDKAFDNCLNLVAINVDEGNENYCDVDGALLSKDKTTFLMYPAGKNDSTYTVPDGVTTIGDYAFWRRSISEVVIPDSVTTIGNFAFSESSITEIVMRKDMTTIGDNAFSGCYRFYKTVIPSTVTSIADNAFDFGSNVLIICEKGSYAETYAKGKEIETGNLVTSSDVTEDTSADTENGGTKLPKPDKSYTVNDFKISVFGNEATITKYYGKEELVVIPEEIDGYKVTTIGDQAFSECESLTKIILPNSITTIGIAAFNECTNLTDIVLPSSVTTIDISAFYWCQGLTEINLPESVTSIGALAFYGCSNVTEISIPKSVTNIGNGAFAHCYRLEKIVVSADNTEYCDEDGILLTKDKSAAVIYPAGKYVSLCPLPDSVTTICDNSFDGCVKLYKIELPDNVTNIGTAAFLSCTGLREIRIPSSVTTIGDYAFDGCEKLTIKCSAGSYAETYAKENGLKYSN